METTAVRVTSGARRHLADLAAARGSSMTQALSTLIDEAWWEEACRQERQARRNDLDDPAFLGETEDWDALNDDELI